MTEMQHLDNNMFAKVIATLTFAKVNATEEFDLLWQIIRPEKISSEGARPRFPCVSISAAGPESLAEDRKNRPAGRPKRNDRRK